MIKVFVKTRSSNERIEEQEDLYTVYVNTPPVNNLANKRVLKLLAAHLDIPKTSMEIVRGKTASIKFIEIDGE